MQFCLLCNMAYEENNLFSSYPSIFIIRFVGPISILLTSHKSYRQSHLCISLHCIRLSKSAKMSNGLNKQQFKLVLMREKCYYHIFFSPNFRYVDLEGAGMLLLNHCFGNQEKGNLSYWCLNQNEKEMQPLFQPEDMLLIAM